MDSAFRMLDYPGARTDVQGGREPPTKPPDTRAIADRFETLEAAGAVCAAERRDTTRASVGGATFSVGLQRPLARGETLLGDVIAYDRVCGTGANAATQFTTSAPITLAGLSVPAGPTHCGRSNASRESS